MALLLVLKYCTCPRRIAVDKALGIDLEDQNLESTGMVAKYRMMPSDCYLGLSYSCAVAFNAKLGLSM